MGLLSGLLVVLACGAPSQGVTEQALSTPLDEPIEISTADDGRAQLLSRAGERQADDTQRSVDSNYPLTQLADDANALWGQGAGFSQLRSFYEASCAPSESMPNPLTPAALTQASVRRLQCGRLVLVLVEASQSAPLSDDERQWLIERVIDHHDAEGKRVGIVDEQIRTELLLARLSLADSTGVLFFELRNTLFVGYGDRLGRALELAEQSLSSSEHPEAVALYGLSEPRRALAGSHPESPYTDEIIATSPAGRIVFRHRETGQPRASFFFVSPDNERKLILTSFDTSQLSLTRFTPIDAEVIAAGDRQTVRVRFEERRVGVADPIIVEAAHLLDIACDIEASDAWCVSSESGFRSFISPLSWDPSVGLTESIPFGALTHLGGEPLGDFGPVTTNTRLEIRPGEFRIPGIPGQHEWRSIENTNEAIRAHLAALSRQDEVNVPSPI